MKSNKFPTGWDEQSVRELIDYYESQTDEEAAAEHFIARKDADSAREADPPGPTGRQNPAQG